MNNERFLCGTIAVAAAMFAFEWLFHGDIMMPLYAATSKVWRPAAEMHQFFAFCVVTKLTLGAIITAIFAHNYEAKGLREGVRFGLYVGMLLGVEAFRSYTYLPVPLSIPMHWFFGWLAEGIIIGAALAWTFERCGRKA